jgi:DNA invertase Pin-like site-specific DNA recombinase
MSSADPRYVVITRICDKISTMTIHAAIYARTSPDCLFTEDEQIDRLSEIATDRGWAVISVFTDRPMTVRKRQDRRPGEIALINTIQSGAIDRVLVWSIDRIGKSLVELVGLMETCRLAGTSLWVEAQKLDTATSNGMSVFDVTSMMALHLRQARRDSILRGQAAARSLSIRFGRPPLTKAKVEQAKQFLAAGKGVREIARLASISPTSVSRIKTSINTQVARI